MPVHDWTRVSAGTFHDFHCAWIAELRKALNRGLLPADYYALSEQVAGQIGPDVLTLRAPASAPNGERPLGATAVLDAPPKVSIVARADETGAYAMRSKSLVIRHSSGDQIIALIEIVSPGNKDRQQSLDRLIKKAVSCISQGIHLLLIDLLPPGTWDPNGIHGALWAAYDLRPYLISSGKPLTLASYSAGVVPVAHVEPIAVGEPLPDMPLFLEEEFYINVPLEETYQAAYDGEPMRWRRVLEATDE